MPNSQLVELYARGLGVIDDARVEFGEGFNVITGETGAGKTLLLDALDLCLGGEAATSRQAVRGDMRASAVFIDRQGRELVLSRESGASGRLRSAIDGVSASTEALRTLALGLIVIHGQHDSLNLRSRAEILRIVDASAGVSTEALENVRHSLRECQALRERYGGDGDQRLRELDFLQFQINELTGARLRSSDELDETMAELSRLSDLRDGQAALAEVLEELDGDRDEAILTRLARTIERLPAGEMFDKHREILRGSLESAREEARELAVLSDPESFDVAALSELEGRVSLLQQIARKYGGSLEAALATLVAHLDEQRRRMDESARVETLDVEIIALERQEVDLARVARFEREAAAAQLTRNVSAQLPRVALANATLRFEVDGADGADARIVFSANPGLAEGPLQALASGGELSRVLLALSLETVHDDVVAVFDEVDAGVGGQVAQQIGDCLQELGRKQQVLAVTHLASVAAKADHHYVIDKQVRDDSTSTTVRCVTGDERINEIARMLAGDDLTVESRALARQLLETLR
jgi:DNA repair protein RecN (Recombination protein N)